MICDKVSYDSYQDAQKASRKISIREKQGFRTYKCNECGKYHLTSIKTKSNKSINNQAPKSYLNKKELKFYDESIKNIKNKKYTPIKNVLSTFKLGELLNWPLKNKKHGT